MAMKLISTITVGAGGAADIEWTNIPQNGKDLLVLVSSRQSNAANSTALNLRLNGNSVDLSFSRLLADGSTIGFSTGTGSIPGENPGTSATANTFGNNSFYISNYTVSQNKLVNVDGVSGNNATTTTVVMTRGEWAGSAAVSSVLVKPNSTNDFVQHTTASLYIIS